MIPKEKRISKRPLTLGEKDSILTVRILSKVKLYTGAMRINTEHFCNEFQITGEKLRSIMHALRLGGEPIGSDSKGYFYCLTYAEYEPTERALMSRAKEIMDGAKLGGSRFFGQQQTIFNQ